MAETPPDDTPEPVSVRRSQVHQGIELHLGVIDGNVYEPVVVFTAVDPGQINGELVTANVEALVRIRDQIDEAIIHLDGGMC